jgi:FMN phosphatase YigB (HAD superfamily)
MKVFKLKKISQQHLVFDMDSTLYRHEDYAKSQTAGQLSRIAKHFHWSLPEAAEKVAQVQKEYRDKHGRKPSLGNAFKELGIPIELSVKWREEEIKPEDYLQRDEKLAGTLSKLLSKFSLFCLTNNPKLTAIKTMRVLGIERFFPGEKIIGLDETLRSKPDPYCYQLTVDALRTEFEQCIFIGDRLEVDIDYPVSQGAAGIFVESMEEIYQLPDLLLKR